MYIDGYVVPVPTGNKQVYRQMAAKMAAMFKEYGATRIVECWADDVPDGKVTDFKRSVKAEAGETVVFSWVEWPSKAIRDAANEKMKSDDRMKPGMEMPFDGQRMIFGGFEPILELGREGAK